MTYDKALDERIRLVLADKPEVVKKNMFGGTGYLLRGNMACGVTGSNLIVRVGPEEYETALGEPGVTVFDMTGRPMVGWVQVTPAGLPDQAALQSWIERGLAYARSLPPK